MRKLFVFLLECFCFAVFCVGIDRIPWSKLLASILQATGNNSSDSFGTVKATLVGRWTIENGDMKGATMLFTSSGATTWVIPADIFGMTDCTVTGVYRIVRYRGDEQHPAGRYVHSTISDRSGNCKTAFEELPLNTDSKIDVVDENHLLFEGSSLVRTN